MNVKHPLIWLILPLAVVSQSLSAQSIDSEQLDKLHQQGYEAPTLKLLVTNSDLVVVGDVAKGSSRWVGKKIVTDWTVEVRRFFKGQDNEEITVTTYGGQVGDIAQDFTHSAQLIEGTTVVLFLAPQTKRTQELSKSGYFVSYDEFGVIPLLADGESKSRLSNNRRINERLISLEKAISDIQ